MRDWAGNEIKVGHIVKIYMFMNPFAGSEISLLHLDSRKNNIEKIGEFSNDYQWTLVNTHKIIDVNWRILSDGYKPEDIRHTPIQVIDFEINQHPCYAICIQGISDNREKFMLEYFKIK